MRCIIDRSRFTCGARVPARLSAFVSGIALALLALALGTTPTRAQVQVFATDFESGLPAQFSAPGAAIEGVQGWAGLGTAGWQFSGSFLRYSDIAIHPTTLTLAGLPAHDFVNVGFLLAIIDSWDGTELLEVRVDGNLVFSYWFQIATGDTSNYIAPPGGLLSRGTNLGFSAGFWYDRDRAYTMALEPAFQNIPHTASTLTIEWTLGAVSGSAAQNWQGGLDESWAIDEVRVSVGTSTAGIGTGGAGGRLALAPAGANPSRGDALALRITLPEAAAASLTLMDVTGRTLRARDVGTLGAGTHRVDLPGEPLRPGVYHARLVQDGAARVTRLVVTD